MGILLTTVTREQVHLETQECVIALQALCQKLLLCVLEGD